MKKKSIRCIWFKLFLAHVQHSNAGISAGNQNRVDNNNVGFPFKLMYVIVLMWYLLSSFWVFVPRAAAPAPIMTMSGPRHEPVMTTTRRFVSQSVSSGNQGSHEDFIKTWTWRQSTSFSRSLETFKWVRGIYSPEFIFRELRGKSVLKALSKENRVVLNTVFGIGIF